MLVGSDITSVLAWEGTLSLGASASAFSAVYPTNEFIANHVQQHLQAIAVASPKLFKERKAASTATLSARHHKASDTVSFSRPAEANPENIHLLVTAVALSLAS